MNEILEDLKESHKIMKKIEWMQEFEARDPESFVCVKDILEVLTLTLDYVKKQRKC